MNYYLQKIFAKLQLAVVSKILKIQQIFNCIASTLSINSFMTNYLVIPGLFL